jgi:hypothetical protein
LFSKGAGEVLQASEALTDLAQGASASGPPNPGARVCQPKGCNRPEASLHQRPTGVADEWHLDIEKTVTLEQLGSCSACPVSRQKPDLRAIRVADQSRLHRLTCALRSRGPEQKPLRREFTSACRSSARWLPRLAHAVDETDAPSRKSTSCGRSGRRDSGSKSHFRLPSAVKGKAVKRSRGKSPRQTETEDVVTERRQSV